MYLLRYVAVLAALLFSSLLSMSVAKADSPVFVSNGYHQIEGPPEFAFCSGCWGDGQRTVDIFTLDRSYTLTSTDFAISFWSGWQWNFEISIYDSNRKLLYSSMSRFGSYDARMVYNNPDDEILDDVVKVHTNITPVTLGPGSYFMGWYDENMAITGYSYPTPTMQALDPNSPYPARGVAAFQLSGVPHIAAVPEPETYAMLLVGIGLTGAIARRRRHV